MKADQLLQEGMRLAKPSAWLVRAQPAESVAAVWGGEGFQSLAPGLTHLLSIDLRHLPGGRLDTPSFLSVFNEPSDLEGVAIVHDLGLPRSGTTLAEHSRPSLPPTDALFLLGSRDLHEWLRDNDWKPEWGYNSNFRDSALVESYELAFQGQFPLYCGGAVATLGGWHMPWPDGDWEDLQRHRLIATTFEDAEPWVETWHIDGFFKVLNRVT